MNSLRRFSPVFIALCLITLRTAWGQTQPTPAPPVPAQRPGGLPPGGEGSSKMAPTGLAENGGSIANGTYTNSIYGFSMKVPPGWVVVPSKSPVAPDPSSRDAALMKAAQINHVLLVVTENAPMKKSTQRKSIQIVATRLIKKTSPNEGQEYLNYSKRTALERKMAVEYLGDPTEVSINGSKLWTIDLNQSTEGTTQHVQQYVTIQGAILLQFMLVSPDEAGLKDLQPSIQSLKMKPVTEKPTSARSTKKKKPAAAAQ